MAHGKLEYPTAQEDPNEYSFTPEELAEIQRHVAKYPEKRSAVMPALWIAQQKWGWLPQKAILLVADTLGLSYAHVYGVATFYTMYLKENKGKHLIEVCTCFTCGVCGGDDLFQAIKARYNATDDGITPDGKFYFREAECLGACDTAVAGQINNRNIVHNLTVEKLSAILDQLARGEEIPFESVPLADQKAIVG